MVISGIVYIAIPISFSDQSENCSVVGFPKRLSRIISKSHQVISLTTNDGATSTDF